MGVRMSRCVRVVIAVGLVALLAGACGVARPRPGGGEDGTPPAGAAAAAGNAPTAAERSAAAQAHATGRRVEVLAKRSETMEVFAEPNGTFTAQLHPGPVRVRRGRGWVAVDPTLERRADGSVAPRATSVPQGFSGGGSGPLLWLGGDGGRVALGWPGRLPAPRLQGPTATYPEVLPGVDLRLTAGVQGVGEVLVVKNRQAARNPVLTRLRFGVRTHGLRLRIGKDGGSVLVGAGGRTVFSSPPPAMWDAAGRDAVGRFELRDNAISVLPDRRMLTNPATVFPVSIDPDWGAAGLGWAKVFSGYPDRSYFNGGGDVDPDGLNIMKVGQCYRGNPDLCNSIGIARTYVKYDLVPLHDAKVITPNGSSGAEFNAHEIYAPTCDASGHNYAVDLRESAPWDAGLTWGNQGSVQGGWISGVLGGPRYELHGYPKDSRCSSWTSIGWGVGDQVRADIDARKPYIAFILHADNEAEQLAWKKFDLLTLLIHYDFPPNAPSSLSMSTGSNTIPCRTDPASPAYLNNVAGPLTLRATATDRDVIDPLRMEFEWRSRGGGRINGVTPPDSQGNNSVISTTIPAGAFADGQQLSWHARASDAWFPGPWGPQTGSQYCEFNIDNTAPGAPTVMPPDPSAPTPSVGSPATFTVQANDSDVTGFRYGLTQGGTVCATTAGVDAHLGIDPVTRRTVLAAGFDVTPLKATIWDLWVASVDRAGNVTASDSCAHYRFQVAAGRAAVARWALDGHWTQTAVPDSSGHGHDGTATMGPAAWTPGRVGDALQFDGGPNAYVTPGGGQVVRTDQSFSVSAWVRLTGGSGFRTALSQDAGVASGFYLQVTPDNHWAMSDPNARAVSSDPVQVGVWTHLVGTFDQTTREWALYVNGVRAATVVADPASGTIGPVRIGAARWNGNLGDFFPGAVDEVRIYDRVLSDQPYLEPGERAPRSEIDRLASPAVEEAYYSLDEGAGTASGDASGNYRTATLSGDATWAPGKVGPGALHFNGTGAATTRGPAVRTDSSFTVTASVKADVLGSGSFARTAVSQDGSHGSGFYLQYRGDTGKWTFVLLDNDLDQAGGVLAQASAAPVAGEWTALAGVSDAAAREIRLYVNGVLAAQVPYTRTPWKAAGALVIGRAKYNSVLTDYWKGSVDEVHLHSGVLSDAQIAELSGQSEPIPPSPYAGAFERFAKTDGGHYTGPGPVPTGYYLEGPIGFSAPEGAPNTRVIYSCRGATGFFFLDVQSNCGGAEVLGRAGLMYTTPPAGVPTAAVYRCLFLVNGDRFTSFDSNCESTPDKVRQELALGYTRLVTPLIRYLGPGGAHWTSSHGQLLPAGYAPETVLGYVSMGGIGGSPPLLQMCQDGDDEFLSTDAACEGKRDMGTWSSGWVWTSPPAGVTRSSPLYACRSGGERFESLDQFCEGGTRVNPGASLGYVITQL